MNNNTDPVVTAAFERFADKECGDESLYAALCRVAVAEPSVLSLMNVAPREQRRANLLLAAVHYLLLSGVKHPLAAYYPSVGGSRGIDAALHGCFVDFCSSQRTALVDLIAARTTQTNEAGRCAVLWPVLQWIAKRRGFERIALLDFGCSAGLNLGVDRYRYDYGRMHLAPGGRDASVLVSCKLVGPAAPRADLGLLPRIERRLGIDVDPIDVRDDKAARWLQACVWPFDALRRERLQGALRIAHDHGWPVQRHADCSLAVEPWVRGIEPGVLPVLLNSWVLTYLTREAREAHIARMRQLVQQHRMAWISAESSEIVIDPQMAPPDERIAMAQGGTSTPWTLTMPGDGRTHSQVVAISHPHGKWLQWLAD